MLAAVTQLGIFYDAGATSRSAPNRQTNPDLAPTDIPGTGYAQADAGLLEFQVHGVKRNRAAMIRSTVGTDTDGSVCEDLASPERD